ncbi:MAG: 16S rRNA processing protein RimM [Clostridium sp.]|nr:16S rRNA processing protein RimM [Clostridium sp.]
MTQYLEIGKIVNTHGILGEFKVIPLTDDPKRYDKLEWVYISRKIGGKMKKYDITYVRYHKNFVFIKVKGIDDLNASESVKNHFIIIDRENALKLPEDTFFICDLIGIDVYEVEGNRLGVLADVLQTGSNDVYVIKSDNKGDILIPALKEIVKGVCLKHKKMMVILPQGLMDDDI